MNEPSAKAHHAAKGKPACHDPEAAACVVPDILFLEMLHRKIGEVMNMRRVSPGCQAGKMGGNDIDNGSVDTHTLNSCISAGMIRTCSMTLSIRTSAITVIFKWQVFVQIGYDICGITVITIHADIPRLRFVSTTEIKLHAIPISRLLNALTVHCKPGSAVWTGISRAGT